MGSGRLDVYWFALDASAGQAAAWREWLSPAERQRADRYLDPVHGHRYVAAHAHLRWVLAQRLDCTPAEAVFTRGPHGKPRLEGEGPCFNLSHSHGLGLIGVHDTAEVGVDVEYQERVRNWTGLAQRCFHTRECAWLGQQPEAEQPRQFCRLWTLKEAWMKADGRGLAGLHEPEVAWTASGAELRALGRRWFCQEGTVVPGYAAAAVTAAEPAGVNWIPLRLGA